MAKRPVKYYVVDAFTECAFKGNPAAVCLLEDDRDEQWLKSVAAEFNLSETCYLTRINDSSTHIPRFRLRWFTPVTEVLLCGHATLASAHTLFSTGLVNSDLIEFETLSGILTAKKVPNVERRTGVLGIQDDEEYQQYYFWIELDFPVVPSIEFNSTQISQFSKALNGAAIIDIKRTMSDDNFVVQLESAKSVIELEAQVDEIRKCIGDGIIVTGAARPESGYDFATRCFFPKVGINEDPVTGSAYCALAPFWSQKLGKCDFIAYQASARGGMLLIHLDEKNQRVLLRGKAVTVMEGTLLV